MDIVARIQRRRGDGGPSPRELFVVERAVFGRQDFGFGTGVELEQLARPVDDFTATHRTRAAQLTARTVQQFVGEIARQSRQYAFGRIAASERAQGFFHFEIAQRFSFAAQILDGGNRVERAQLLIKILNAGRDNDIGFARFALATFAAFIDDFFQVVDGVQINIV